MSGPALPREVTDRLVGLALHRDTLLYAMEQLGEGFPRDAFVAAATSRDPALRAQVLAVERGFELLVNVTVELTVAALELAGERVPGSDVSAPRELRAFRDCGGIPAGLCERLIALQRARNDLQHDYPGVLAASLHAAVVELVAVFPAFMTAYARWLRGRAGA